MSSVILPTNKEDLIKFLLDNYHRNSEVLQAEKEKWLALYKLYRSYLDENMWPFVHKIFIPYAFSLIETELPAFSSSLLFRNPLIQVLRDNPFTDRDSARAVSLLLNQSWMVDSETWCSLLMMLKEKSLVGTSIAKKIWSHKRKVVPVYEPVDLNGRVVSYIKGKKSVTIENRPRIVHRDIYHLTPDLQNGRNPRWMFDACIKPLDEILYGDIEYENLSGIEKMANWTYDGDYEDWLYNRLSSVESDYPMDADSIDLVRPRHILEFVVRERTREGEEVRVITLLNKERIIRDETLTCWPYLYMWNYMNPHEFFGMSELEAIEKLQHGYNAHFGIILENMLMAMSKMFIVGDNADVEDDTFALEPMGVIRVADITQIKDLSFGDMSQGAYGLLQTYPNLMDKTTGINDAARGESQRREYATTTLALQQASRERLNSKIQFDEKMSIAPCAEGFVELAQYEMEESNYVPLDKKRDQWEEVMLHQIQGQMSFRCMPAAAGFSDIQRQQMNEFTNTMAAMLGPNTPPEVKMELLTAISETYNNERLSEAMEKASSILSQVQGAGPPQQGAPPPTTQTGNSSANQRTSVGALGNMLAASQGGAY